MDWLPNIEGMLWFAKEILPLIRRRRPNCRVVVVGRRPGPEILDLAAADPGIEVTGTVPDVRPYLWKSQISILPLRIVGGTRVKVYEATPAGSQVGSPSISIKSLALHAE